MKTTIYNVSFTSYTESDMYLHNDIKTFTSEEEARQEFISLRDQAIEESQWGSLWDASDEEREDGTHYAVDENSQPNLYRANSNAYEGYHVEVRLQEVEVELPHATDRRKYGMTVKELADLIADFTGDKKREAMRKAKIFGHHISLRHVSSIESICYGKYGSYGNYYGENRNILNFRWCDLDGDSDVFSIIE